MLPILPNAVKATFRNYKFLKVAFTNR